MTNKKFIACNLTLFDLYKEILLVDENNKIKIIANNIPTKDLSAIIPLKCEEYQINNVRLFGAKSYGEKIAQEIINQNQIKYNKKLNVEVIEK